MKNLIFCLLIIFIAGCKDGVISECVGTSSYYIDNQTDKIFYIFYTSPLTDNKSDTTKLINKERVLIAKDAIFGAIPRPADTFTSLTLYTLTAGKQDTVYLQTPIENMAWSKRKHHKSDPDYGCQNVDYTLTITKEMLK